MMDATDQTYRIADQILTLLAKENCTVLQATEILTYVRSQILNRSTVQYQEGALVELFNSVD